MLFRILQHALDGREREAVAWLKKRHRTKPFFMNYWQFSVHAPFGAMPELTNYYHTRLCAARTWTAVRCSLTFPAMETRPNGSRPPLPSTTEPGS